MVDVPVVVIAFPTVPTPAPIVNVVAATVIAPTPDIVELIVVAPLNVTLAPTVKG